MTRPVLLNNVEHGHLRVITRRAAEFGDAVHAVLTFPTEFADVQREYPILFRRDPAIGEYRSMALLGFAEGENLFLDEHGWSGRYVPAIVARGPFLIGFQEQEVDGETRREPVVHVDLDDPRVNEREGEPLFLEHGGNAPYLRYVADLLRGIREGIEIGTAMFAAFERHGLIEPVNLEVDVLDDVRYVLRGWHTISRDRLAALDGAALAELNRAGFLEGAYLVLASLSNVPQLIERKRRRLAQA
jgi:hypothetical protein